MGPSPATQDALMVEDPSFAQLLARIRSGDERVAGDLVRQYEPVIRFEVRRRLRDARLRRVFDSLDICQSVLFSFFAGAAEGRYELAGPNELVRLLVAMTRNKLAHHVRQQRSQRRDHRRLTDCDLAPLSATPATNPSRILESRDYLDELRHRLSPVERQMADLRAQGLAWSEIAAQLGGTPQARRMQLARALRLARQQLGEHEGSDDRSS
jgi:RNA polymerase sigma-70 factor (ECF subfamily)